MATTRNALWFEMGPRPGAVGAWKTLAKELLPAPAKLASRERWLVASPFGLAEVATGQWRDAPVLLALDFPAHPDGRSAGEARGALRELLDSLWLEAPPASTRLHLLLTGTALQLAVWQALAALAPGETRSYAAVAEAAGSPRAVRAAASAVGANPVSWIIPCHRVLRADGSLGGYHWGLALKRAMLAWESAPTVP